MLIAGPFLYPIGGPKSGHGFSVGALPELSTHRITAMQTKRDPKCLKELPLGQCVGSQVSSGGNHNHLSERKGKEERCLLSLGGRSS